MTLEDILKIEDPNQKASQLRTYLDSLNKNEAELSTDELKSKLTALQELGKFKPSMDIGDLSTHLRRLMTGYGVQPDVSDKALPLIIDSIKRHGGYAGAETLVNEVGEVIRQSDSMHKFDKPWEQGGRTHRKFGEIAGAIDPLFNFLSNQEARTDLVGRIQGQTKAKDITPDVNRITEALRARGETVAKEEDYNKFLKTAPGEASDRRQGYYDTLTEGATQFLRTREQPSILAELNRKGRAMGGGADAVLGSRAADLQGNIETIIAQQESADSQFFANAAYQLTLSKLQASEAEFRNQIDFLRQQGALKQEQDFRSNQLQLDRDLNQDLLNRQTQSALKTGKDTTQTRVDNQLQTSRDQAILDASEAGGTVVTSALVNKAPAKVKETIG